MKNVKKPHYVLVMEENSAHAELLTEILDRHFSPIVIHTVDTISAGFEFLEQTSYDLIITESIISGESLSQYLKKIRHRFEDIPLIVVTGRGNESLAAQLTKRGAAEYLVKTRETLETLPQILKKYLEPIS